MVIVPTRIVFFLHFTRATCEFILSHGMSGFAWDWNFMAASPPGKTKVTWPLKNTVVNPLGQYSANVYLDPLESISFKLIQLCKNITISIKITSIEWTFFFSILVTLPFIIDPDTGYVSTSYSLDRELQEKYILTVEVRVKGDDYERLWKHGRTLATLKGLNRTYGGLRF